MKQRWRGVARVLDRVTRETDTRSDTELIEAFLGHDDAEAFARLVRRHGAMVQGVCRRVLGDANDVDDAFQATFLVLLRKVPSLQWRDRLGPWLYGVAYRTALKARSRRSRNRAIERPSHAMTTEPTTSAVPLPDGMEYLDEELLALPDKYRLPLVLCELQGMSRREAARQLNLPEGTLSSRLARGRQLLRRRLVRRGVTLSASGLLTLLAAEARADVALHLVGGTVRLAEMVKSGKTAGGAAASVLSLTEGVVKSMLLAKLKVITAILVLLLTLGGAATGTVAMAWGGDDVSPPVAQSSPQPTVLPNPVLDLRPGQEEMFVFRIHVVQRDKNGVQKSVAEPVLMAAAGQKASFLCGGSFPIENVERGARSVDFMPFGTQLQLLATRIDEHAGFLSVEMSFDEKEEVAGFEYRVAGNHTKFKKKITFNQKEAVVLRKHDDGSMACQVEITVGVIGAATSAQKPTPTAIRGAGQELRTTSARTATPPTLPTPRDATRANPETIAAPLPAALEWAFPSSQPRANVELKPYQIELKVLEAATSGAHPEVLTMPRIAALEGQQAVIEVANYPTSRLTMQTTVKPRTEKQVELHLVLSDLKGAKTNGFEVRQVGMAADVQSLLELNRMAKIVLTNHADGTEKIWAEVTVKEGPPVVTEPPTAGPASVPAPIASSVVPYSAALTTAKDAGTVIIGGLKQELPQPAPVTWQGRLQLVSKSTSDGPRVELRIGNVRLEAMKINIGTGQGAYRFEAAPNGILVHGQALTTVCSEMDFGGGIAVKEAPFSTKDGRFRATYHAIKDAPPVARIQWGDAVIECTKLEIGNEVALTVHKDGMTVSRGNSTIKAEQIEIDFGTQRLTVNGKASLEKIKE